MKRGLVVVAIAVLGIAIVLWLRRSNDDRSPVGETGSDSNPASQPLPGVRSMRSADAPPPAWFIKAGVNDRKIAGRVVFEGKPIRARVALHSLVTKAGIAAPLVRDTGDDGTFDFGPQRPARYQVIASANNLTAAIAQLDLTDPTAKPPSDKLELELRACTVAVAGTIFDSSGGPIGGARVRRDGLVGADANAKGQYRVCVPRGNVELEYSADGYGGVSIGRIAHGELEQNVVLVPEGTVTVIVVRATDGKPVEDALVSVMPKEWGRDRRAVRLGLTAADGKARISGLTPGGYRVWVTARGLIPEATQGPEVVIEVGASPEVTIKLSDTARISGRVMRGSQPIAGATVVALRKSPVRRSSPAISQEDGSFVLDDVPAGELIFDAHPYKVKTPATFQAEAKSYDNVELQVEPMGRVHGIVTQLGKPQQGAEVCCLHGPTGRRAVTAAADGSYEFLGVEPGPHELLAGYYDDAFVLPTKFTLGAGETKRLDFELDQAGTIAGTVVDKAGKPVPGVFVAWLHEKTGDVGRGATDAQGRYRCGAMTGGGTYRASVSAARNAETAQGSQRPFPTADGAPYPTLVVKDGKTVIENVELKIDLQKLQIAGRVVDGNGAAVADAQVRAALATGGGPANFNTWQKLPSTFTDTEGNFTLGELTAGNYAIQARSSDGGEGVLANVATGTTGAVIKLVRPAGIEGKLVGFTAAAPVVYAVPLGGNQTAWTAGTVDGQAFRVRGLAPGRYMVSAQTTYEGDGKVVTVESGKVTPLTLTSRGRATIEATLIDFRSNGPIPGGACHVLVASDGVFGVTNWDFTTAPKSDAAGRVLLEPSPAGQVTVECALPTPKWSMPTAELTVDSGGRATIQLYGVEMSSENPSDPGIEFDHFVIAPVVARVKAQAAKAGVMPGDRVISVDGVSVTKLDRSGVDVLLRSHGGGDDIVLGVQRGTATKTFTFFATQ